MNWSGLPERYRGDPLLTSYRIDDLQDRVEALESRPTDQQMVQTPMGPIPLKLAIIGFLLMAIFRPDVVAKWMP